MKKTSIALIITLILLSALTTAASAASLGGGVACIAEDIKMIKSSLFGQKIVFSDTDVKTALGITSFDKITIVSVPKEDEGSLTLGEKTVEEGTQIRRRNMAKLVFTPANDKVEKATFRFTVDNYAGGAEIECILRFTDKINYAPQAPGASADTGIFTTQRDISIWGALSAEDKEGDELEYIIVSLPKRGDITLGEGGKFKYTPDEGYSGRDSFSYVVRDEWGNFSKVAKVSLKITERISEVVYVDMLDSESYNASVAMSGMGIMSGTLVGDDMYFNPEGKVSRAEFVAMAMKAVGMRADKNIGESFFDDNADIPSSLIGYVATAQAKGIITGSFEKDGLMFRPNDSITKYEAGIIMANLLGVSDTAASAELESISTVPVFARGKWGAMLTLGIFGSDAAGARDAITRENACEYLYKLSMISSK